MAKLPKKLSAAVAQVEHHRRYQPLEAVTLAKQVKFAKFDETLCSTCAWASTRAMPTSKCAA